MGRGVSLFRIVFEIIEAPPLLYDKVEKTIYGLTAADGGEFVTRFGQYGFADVDGVIGIFRKVQ